MTDRELLRAYAADGSTSAFGEIVKRHLPLVLSASRRQLAIPHLAEDVAQETFALLARKADRLGDDTILSGWLYRAACHLAAENNRRESRRHHRELAAMSAMNASISDETWPLIAPLLDEAMATLSERDRDAVVLRFFENKSLREVGAALGTNDDAAQKRLGRAVERLRSFFARRGQAIGTGTFTAALAVGAIQPAPDSLAAAISVGALSSVGAPAGLAPFVTVKLVKPILFAVGAGLIAVALLKQERQVERLRLEKTALQAQLKAMPITPANAPTETPSVDIVELLRLRSEVTRLRNLEVEIKRLQAELSARSEMERAPADSTKEEPEQLYSRRYKVDPAIFMQNLQTRLNRTLPANSAPSSTDTPTGNSAPEIQSAVRDCFREAGVNFPDVPKTSSDSSPQSSVGRNDRAVFFNDGTGILFVRATLADLDLVEQVVQQLNSSDTPDRTGTDAAQN